MRYFHLTLQLTTFHAFQQTASYPQMIVPWCTDNEDYINRHTATEEIAKKIKKGEIGLPQLFPQELMEKISIDANSVTIVGINELNRVDHQMYVELPWTDTPEQSTS
jgi:hypothetical protein